MKILSASFDVILWRFYLMMGIVIASFFLGFPLLSILAFPVFVSALLGISFRTNNVKAKGMSHDKRNVQQFDIPIRKAA